MKSRILVTIYRECDARDVDNAQNLSICTVRVCASSEKM